MSVSECVSVFVYLDSLGSKSLLAHLWACACVHVSYGLEREDGGGEGGGDEWDVGGQQAVRNRKSTVRLRSSPPFAGVALLKVIW